MDITRPMLRMQLHSHGMDQEDRIAADYMERLGNKKIAQGKEYLRMARLIRTGASDGELPPRAPSGTPGPKKGAPMTPKGEAQAALKAVFVAQPQRAFSVPELIQIATANGAKITSPAAARATVTRMVGNGTITQLGGGRYALAKPPRVPDEEQGAPDPLRLLGEASSSNGTTTEAAVG